MIYCCMRKTFVVETPEERVRQGILGLMLHKLGYPASGLVVEQSLHTMPHIKGGAIPDRRADIICFGKGIHPKFELYPLLLVECKASKITASAINQVIGYNYYLKAYLIAIAGKESIKTGWFNHQEQKYCFTEGLPRYEVLLRGL